MPMEPPGIWRLSTIPHPIYTQIIEHRVNKNRQKELPVSDQPIEENVTDVNLTKVTVNEESITSHRKRNSFKKSLSRYWAIFALFTYILGLGSGYLLRGKTN